MNIPKHLRTTLIAWAALGAAWAVSCSTNEGAPPAQKPPEQGSLAPVLGAYCRDDCVLAGDGKCDEYDLTCAPGSDCTDCGGTVTGGACEDTCRFALDGACDSPFLCAPGTDCSDCAGALGAGGSSSGPTCQDTCRTAVDGECDEPDLCDPGTDCSDCKGQSGPGPSCPDGAPCACQDDADCPQGESCDANEKQCRPACGGMQCGTDQGVDCGICGGGTRCSSELQCAAKIGGISAGVDSTCAWKADGTVACWGWNGYGQVGDGTKTQRRSPVVVAGLSGVTQVHVRYHACALKADETMACWGNNENGQLGNGTVNGGGLPEQLTPGPVVGLSGVTHATAGSSSNCAVKADKSVVCWGHNPSGSLGDGTNIPQRPLPARIGGLGRVVQVAAGNNHTCALREDRSVVCWGLNGSAKGVIGDGAFETRTSPVAVPGLGGVRSIAAGPVHNCAARFDGTVACWGRNVNGQVGPTAPSPAPSPVDVPGLTGVASLALGAEFSCALKQDGTVACWGDNGYGQLGDGTKTDRAAPVSVSGVTDAVALAAGIDYACVLRSSGVFSCWGHNDLGQLGDGTTTDRPTPVNISW